MQIRPPQPRCHMLEVLQFVFQSGWHWAGATVMLIAIVTGLVTIVALVTDKGQ